MLASPPARAHNKTEDKDMRKLERHSEYRIESNRALRSPHWWPAGARQKWLHHDRSLAVALAAKTRTVPCGGEVRVVHMPTGEVIFRKLNECGCGN